MKRILTLALFLVLATSLSISGGKDKCYQCHYEDVGDEPAELFSGDVHYKVGLSCADCHGGDRNAEDMDEAMSEEKGYIGVPEKDKIADVCLNCHADENKMKSFGSKIDVEQFKLFKSSVHGKSEIATCVTCHGIHNIKRHTNPASPVYPTKEIKLCSKCHSNANYMKKFNPRLPTDQFDKYKTSVHGKRILKGDIKVATCSDCHSAHAIFPANDPRATIYPVNLPKTCAKCHSNKEYMKAYKIPTDQFEKFAKSVHGVALLKKQDTGAPACNDCHGNHGAIPPGVKSISHVCGICHALNADMFSKSPHAVAFEKKKIPQCEVCHGNHLIKHPTDEMIGVDEKSVCTKCHKSEREKAFQVALKMRTMLDSLVSKEKKAKTLLDEAENKGMEVSDARFELKNVAQILIKARTVTHTANLNEFEKTIKPGFETAEKVIKAGEDALYEYNFRRWGLGVSTLFITLLAIGLYLKIREIEKRQQR